MHSRYVLSLISPIFLPLSACNQIPVKSQDAEVNENSQKDYQQAVKREQEIAKTNPWHAAKLNGASFRAIGQEPAWLVEIYPDESIYLSRDYGNKIQSFKYQSPVTDKKKRRSVFKLESQGQLIIDGKACNDIMSGEQFETTVTIIIGKQSLKGCGKSLY